VVSASLSLSNSVLTSESSSKNRFKPTLITVIGSAMLNSSSAWDRSLGSSLNKYEFCIKSIDSGVKLSEVACKMFRYLKKS